MALLSPMRSQSIAECVGKSMNTVKSWGMRYIGPSYHIAMPTAQTQSAEEWRALLRRPAAENTSPKPPQRILLVCGISHVSHGLENLLAVIRYRLHVDPLGGDLFVFCGTGHKTLVTLEWDGGGLRVAKRRSQRGVYPWPPRRLGPLTIRRFQRADEVHRRRAAQRVQRGGSGRRSRSAGAGHRLGRSPPPQAKRQARQGFQRPSNKVGGA